MFDYVWKARISTYDEDVWVITNEDDDVLFDVGLVKELADRVVTDHNDNAALRERLVDAQQDAFIAGAKWWEYTSRGAPMWPSEQNQALVEAQRQYQQKEGKA